MNNIIDQSVETLKNGGVIIYPTDTAFGIGCRIDDNRAVARLLSIKGRPENKPLPILVSDVAMAVYYTGNLLPKIEDLMDNYWPGGLTIVVPAKTDKIISAVLGGKNTVGMRMPDHEELLEIIQGVGVPIIGSSANFSGKKTPFSVSELDPELVGQVDFVVKGTCGGSLPSTVIDTTVNPWKILRQGKVVVHEVNA